MNAVKPFYHLPQSTDLLHTPQYSNHTHLSSPSYSTLTILTMRCSVLFLFLSVVAAAAVQAPVAAVSIGINYGQIANNLPSPEKVVPLVKSIGAKKVKLYDANGAILQAFANTGVEFVVCIPNECLSTVRDHAKALAWVKDNVQCYLPATKITSITVGNEILTSNSSAMAGDLLPAMESVHQALVDLGLDKQVKVTTAHSLAVLKTSYPPSTGTFRPDLVPYISPILNFHAKTGSPFLINAYPYFAYKASPKQVSLDFVLFQPNQGIIDSGSKLKYDNMLLAQIDAVYAAMDRVGCKGVAVQISETGWPSRGDEDEAGASAENARKYNGNLLKLVEEGKGTPARPDTSLDVFVFALFNENLKPGPTSERNYGLFKPDGSPAYPLALSSVTGEDGHGNSSGGRGGATAPPSWAGDNDGFFNFSAAQVFSLDRGVFLLILLISLRGILGFL